MTYKGFLLASAGGLAAASGSAQAADLPVKAAMAAPVAVNWTGWYAGLHAGGAWQSMNGYQPETAYQGISTSASSFLGGGQIGYNWQHGNFVYGVEADISGLSSGARHTGVKGGVDALKAEIKWLSTYRVRAGLAVGDTMAYMTGGLAVGGVKNSFQAFPGDAIKSESKTKVGWAIGGGVEHMWDRNWSIALEAMFVDLGRSTVDAITNSGAIVPEKRTTFRNQAIIGRAKVNYQF